MEISPPILGEIDINRSEKQKELAELLCCDGFIDRLAELNEYSSQTNLVGGFAVYKNGGFNIGSVVGLSPDNVSHLSIRDDEHPWLGATSIYCQEDLNCCEYISDPANKYELYMLLHSHPSNNTHCIRNNDEDLLAPTTKDLEDWYKDDSLRDLINGVMVCKSGCKSLLLFKKNPQQETRAVWRVLGHGLGIGKNSVEATMQAGGLLVSEINLNCHDNYYKKQARKTALQLISN